MIDRCQKCRFIEFIPKIDIGAVFDEQFNDILPTFDQTNIDGKETKVTWMRFHMFFSINFQSKLWEVL